MKAERLTQSISKKINKLPPDSYTPHVLKTWHEHRCIRTYQEEEQVNKHDPLKNAIY